MRRNLSFAGGLLLAIMSTGNMAYAQEMVMSPNTKVNSPDATELRLEMRKLWEDHIVYTRNYIISALGDLEDVEKVSERLLSNQGDIGNAIKPYYGDAAGDQLTTLLRDHIVVATEVVKAAKAGNAEELGIVSKKWTANGNEIAVLLSGANPNWPIEELSGMLNKHLELTTGEVMSRLKKDWASDIANYDKGHVHMLMFADMLTDGIVKQFPDRFKK